jgi:hypothetical protein
MPEILLDFPPAAATLQFDVSRETEMSLSRAVKSADWLHRRTRAKHEGAGVNAITHPNRNVSGILLECFVQRVGRVDPLIYDPATVRQLGDQNVDQHTALA